ncbi:MAG: MCP four helix bundle domain-containing protein, partial [Rhodocyclaceae bacterium]|nr:MCP four helix bundle domain-containing protein [Rhodocyclaceae bacterium]
MKNLKIGVRLAMAFAVLNLLLVVIAVVSVNRLNLLAYEIDIIVNDRYEKTVWANNVLDQINIASTAVRNAVAVSNQAEAERQMARVPPASAVLTENLNKLRETIRSERGRALLQQVESMRAPYVEHLRQLDGFIRSGNREAGVQLVVGDMQRSQDAYLAAVTGIVEFQGELMRQEGATGLRDAAQARMIMIVLGILAVVLGVVMAYLITRSIVRPVNEVAQAARRMSKGDFGFSLQSDARDEVGEVVRAVADVQGSVKALITDAAMLSDAAVAGKLATRADATKHQGDYRRIVQGVNDTLDAVIGPLNVAADYVDRIAKGAIPAKITDSYNGDFNTIKNNLNTAIDAVNALVADALMLSQAAVDGKLATRADATRHQGDYRRIVQGVNDTLDAVIGPLNVAADYVDRIAKGAIPAKI